jgi:hypothetical protein
LFERLEIPLTASVSRRSLTALLASALSMMALLALLALSPQASAQARSASCPSSSIARPEIAHACAHAKRASRAAHKGKAHGRSKAKKHHKHASKGKTKAARKRAASAAGATTAAVCEDGSAPVNDGGGSFTCADESEPACSNGAVPELSKSGTALVCPAKATDSGSPEAVCEDASAPVRASDGSFSCDDESLPVCEDGSVPVPSSSGSTLICGGESSLADEVGCEDGSIPVQAADGSYSCAGASEFGCESGSAPALSSAHWTSVCDVPEGEP